MCGDKIIDSNIEFQGNGQYNFVLSVICKQSLTWVLNGSTLTYNPSDQQIQTCASIGFQKSIISISTLNPTNISLSQQLSLQSGFSSYFSNVEPGRINVTVNSNDDNTSHNILLTIFNNGTIPSSSLVYNLTKTFQEDSSPITRIIVNSNITYSSISHTTLTFNETVGTKRGCYNEDEIGSDTFSVIFGNNNCSKLLLSTDQSSEKTAILVVLVIVCCIIFLAIFATAAIIFVKPLRQKVFPHEKKRDERESKKKIVRDKMGRVKTLNNGELIKDDEIELE